MPFNIQGNTVELGTEPFLRNDKNYVSLREVTEALGGQVTFDNSSKTAQATIGPWVANVPMASDEVTVEGNGTTTPVTITAPAYVDNDEMYVPFDFFRDAYGYDVTFDSGTISITNPNG